MLFAVCVAAAAITPRLRLEVTLGLADKASFVATYDATEAERAVSIASSARVRCCFALDGVHSGCTGFDAAWRAEGGLGLLARGEHAPLAGLSADLWKFFDLVDAPTAI